jgi:hypothetical protein
MLSICHVGGGILISSSVDQSLTAPGFDSGSDESLLLIEHRILARLTQAGDLIFPA